MWDMVRPAPLSAADAASADVIRAVDALASYGPSVDGRRPWHFVPVGHSIEARAYDGWSTTPLDVEDRRLHIAAGASVELARLAVRDLGFSCVVRLPPRCVGGAGHVLGTLTVGHEFPVTPFERRLIDAVPHLQGRLSHPPPAHPLRDALAVAAGAAAERGCWLRVLDRPSDRRAIAALLDELHQPEPHAGMPSGNDTLLLVGTDDDTPRAWLRCGRALVLTLLVLLEAGLDTDWTAAAGNPPQLRMRLQRSLGLLGSPQLMLAVA